MKIKHLLQSRIVKFGILLNILTWALAVFIINNHYHNEIEKAKDTVSNLSTVMEKHIIATFSNIESSLNFIKHSYEENTDINKTHILLDQLVSSKPDLFNLVTIINKDGLVIATNQKTFSPTYSGDRSFFIHHKNSIDDKLFIDKPLLGRVTGKWYIPVSLALTDSANNFLGAILASVNPDYFSNLFSDMSSNKSFIIYIADTNGNIYSGIKKDKKLFEELSFILETSIDKDKLVINENFNKPKIENSLIDSKKRIIKQTILKNSIHTEHTDLFFSIELCKQGNLTDFAKSVKYIMLIQSLLSLLIFWGIYRFYISTIQQELYTKTLKLQKDTLNNILEGTNAGTWEWDIIKNEININAKYAEICGYTLEELLPFDFETWRALVHPEDHSISQNIINSITEGKIINIEFECRLKHKNGNYIWVQNKGMVVSLSQEDKPLLIQGIILNISKLKAVEESLKYQNQLITTLLKNLQIGIYMIAVPDGKPLIANEAAQKLLGRGILPDINKDNIGEIYNVKKKNSGKAYPVSEMPIIRGMYGYSSYVNDMTIEKPDGTTILLEVYGSPIKDDNGNVWASLVSFQDITERVHTEESINKYHKLESLGVLAGGIAHDFNNILTGVFGYIELALMFTNEQKVVGFLKSSLNSIERAKFLSNKLLTFSKGGDPVIEQNDIQSFLKESVKSIMQDSKISLELDIPEDLQCVLCDKNQIYQVINNLTTNAIEAMPETGVLQISAKNVSIHNHNILNRGDYVKITFCDTGNGISENDLNFIFDPFYTTKFMGQGLGLTTSFSIINKHKGCIEVESEIGKGSKFHFYLPADKIYSINNLTNTGDKVNDSKTILIMDDEDLIRDIYEQLLSNIGYRVVSTKEGKEAIDVYLNDKNNGNFIKAIILDLMIPKGMGGLEVVKFIRKIDSEIPVFISSGYATNPIMANPEEFGFNDCITKPFSLEKLVSLLDKYIN